MFYNDFQPYSIRASANTQICYLRPQLLLRLLQKYPAIKQNLVERAKLRDLLLLYHEVNQCDRLKTANLQKILPNLTNHQLEAGNNLPDSLWQQKLWLLRRGELIHSSGEKIKPGQIYQPETLPQTGNWLVASPVDLYSLGQTPTKIPSSPRELLEQVDLDESDFADNDFTAVDYAAGVVHQTSPQPTIKNKQGKAVSKAYFPSPKLQVEHFWQQLSQRYPFFLQQSASDCGAACLVMIGRYWGKRFSVNRLRELASVDRNGASLNGLASAAESIGFTTRMVTATLNKLAEQTLPVIAHWQGKHYVVVYKVTRQQVIIADPAIGQLTLSREEFDQGWTGYTLILQPTILLKKASEDNSSLEPIF